MNNDVLATGAFYSRIHILDTQSLCVYFYLEVQLKHCSIL